MLGDKAGDIAVSVETEFMKWRRMMAKTLRRCPADRTEYWMRLANDPSITDSCQTRPSSILPSEEAAVTRCSSFIHVERKDARQPCRVL